jgi:hypothetical protein
MSNLSERFCPLMNKLCPEISCMLFNEKLDVCEIRILNYNLYKLKESIRSLLKEVRPPH